MSIGEKRACPAGAFFPERRNDATRSRSDHVRALLEGGKPPRTGRVPFHSGPRVNTRLTSYAAFLFHFKASVAFLK